MRAFVKAWRWSVLTGSPAKPVGPAGPTGPADPWGRRSKRECTASKDKHTVWQHTEPRLQLVTEPRLQLVTEPRLQLATG